jgi:TonB family protein
MRTLNWGSQNQNSHTKVLVKSALAAFAIEAVLLTAVGWDKHWLAHPQKTTGQDDSRFVEAQMFEVPAEAHLVEEKKVVAAPVHHDMDLSRSPDKGRSVKDHPAHLEEENQTVTGPKISANHGPVAMYAPPPVIPAYLKNQELKTSVVIDFYVNTLGIAAPRLVNSSGNEELDAIAIDTAKKWQFRPGEKDGKPIESKVRLRIVFEVK